MSPGAGASGRRPAFRVRIRLRGCERRSLSPLPPGWPLAFLFSLCSNTRMRGPSDPQAAPVRAPSFTPVPGRARRDGWTAERQRLFIAALARTGCVGRAAAAAGMSRESAHRLRRRAGAGSFAAAWDSILAARPRGTSSPALVWHRLVRKNGGPAAVRREPMAPAEREALQRRALELAGLGRGRGRSQ